MEIGKFRGKLPKLFYPVLRALRDTNNKRGSNINEIVEHMKVGNPSIVSQSKHANVYLTRRALERAVRIGAVRSVGDRYKLNLFKKKLLGHLDSMRPVAMPPLMRAKTTIKGGAGVKVLEKKQEPRTHKALKREMDKFMETVDVGVETDGRKRYNLRQRSKKNGTGGTTRSADDVQVLHVNNNNNQPNEIDGGGNAKSEAVTADSEPARRRPTKYMTRAAEKWLEQKDIKNNSSYL